MCAHHVSPWRQLSSALLPATRMRIDGNERARRLLAVLLLGGSLVLGGPLARPAAADCAFVDAIDALDGTDVVFIGIPVESLGPVPEADRLGEAEMWRFEVVDVFKGSIGSSVGVVYDNWYAHLNPDSAGQETVVLADSLEDMLYAAGCVDTSGLTPTNLRNQAEQLGLAQASPDTGSALGAIAANDNSPNDNSPNDNARTNDTGNNTTDGSDDDKPTSENDNSTTTVAPTQEPQASGGDEDSSSPWLPIMGLGVAAGLASVVVRRRRR